MGATGFGSFHIVDISKTFPPTPAVASMKIAVDVANKKHRLSRHLGHKASVYSSAFDEAMYMRLPAGCSDMSENVVRLQRAVHGFRQTCRQWNVRHSGVLSYRSLAWTRLRMTRVCSIKW